MSITAIVLAAGKGSRMQSEKNKVFLNLENKSILEWSLDKLLSLTAIKNILLVAAKTDFKNCEKLLNQKYQNKNLNLVLGGKSRQKSVNNALNFIMQDINLKQNNNYILVHDGARPFFEKKQVLELEKALKNCSDLDGAILGIPVVDTLKIVDQKNIIVKTPNRSDFWQAQTPQLFKKAILFRAHQNPAQSFTDDASMIEALNGKIKIINGSENNIKITHPQDLILAQEIIKNINS